MIALRMRAAVWIAPPTHFRRRKEYRFAMKRNVLDHALTRRQFLQYNAALGAGLLAAAPFSRAAETPSRVRRFHASLSIKALEDNPDLLPTVARAGVDAVWVAAFLQGAWHYPPETVTLWKQRIEAAGMAMHHITVPLGHPSFTETAPDYMDGAGYLPWQAGVRPDGQRCFGVCLHPPATEVNAEAVGKLYAAAPGTIFLDDDFRLAPSPHDIGGCFCDQHRTAFLEKCGYAPVQWDELLDAVNRRALTPLLRAWLEYTCDELTACFRGQQKALPQGTLGIMVMFLGSEKAGIRLADYADTPMRVGELMFSDSSFAPVKGKTDELFSALFHRRFVRPELAYSETTAWPPDGLSEENLAAKFAVSTLADVRNTMMMSGITPYPLAYWDTLAAAIKAHPPLHARLAGHTPRGPFKHYWGEHSRWVGDANPFSLFLASGIPFEVSETPAEDGYTFLSDADARAFAEGAVKARGSALIHRDNAGVTLEGARPIGESLDAVFVLKHEIMPSLKDVPYVKEDLPVVCGWYPTAGTAALWNLSEQEQPLTVVYKGTEKTVTVGPLGLSLIEA